MENDKKMLCIFTLYSEKGASSNYRILQYINNLSERFEIKTFNFWNDEYLYKYMKNKKKYILHIMLVYFIAVVKRLVQLLFIASHANVVFFQKACIPKCPISFIGLLKKRGIRIVFDVDDAVYLLPGDQSEVIAKRADVILCGNPTLRDYYNRFNANTLLIPTIDRNSQYVDYRRDTFANKVIGWIGSSATINNLDKLVHPINNIITKHPEVKFLVVSDSVGEYANKIQNLILKKWDINTYISSLSEITIGVMPLFDTPVNRGKCGFKLTQYLNLEKPVLASNVGVNAEIVGSAGFVINDDSDWESFLEKLLFDKKIYEDCREKIKTQYEKEYGYDIIFEKILFALGE